MPLLLLERGAVPVDVDPAAARAVRRVGRRVSLGVDARLVGAEVQEALFDLGRVVAGRGREGPVRGADGADGVALVVEPALEAVVVEVAAAARLAVVGDGEGVGPRREGLEADLADVVEGPAGRG